MNRKTILFVVLSQIVTILVVALMLRVNLAQATPNAPAAVPGTVSYQGYLTGADGNPLDGELNLLFEIYADEEPSYNDVPVWAEAPRMVDVKDGYFNVILGETTVLNANVFNVPQRWLQVSMISGTTSTSLPRQPFTAVPYALQAGNADTLDGLDSSSLLGLEIHVQDIINGAGFLGTNNYDLTNYGVPSGIKAVLVQLSCTWTVAGYTGCYLGSGGVESLITSGVGPYDNGVVPVYNDTLSLRIVSEVGAAPTVLLRVLGYIK